MNDNTSVRVIKSGMLEKKGGKKEKAWGESWQKRFFVLKYKPLLSAYELEYYKTSKDSQPKGQITLGKDCVIAPSTRKEFCLSLVTPGREFFFCASDFNEMDQWRRVIHQCIISEGDEGAFSVATSPPPGAVIDRSNRASFRMPLVDGRTQSSQVSNSQSYGNTATTSSGSLSSSSYAGSTTSTSTSSPSVNRGSIGVNIFNDDESGSEGSFEDQYPFLNVSVSDLKFQDVPLLLEQYKDMAKQLISLRVKAAQLRNLRTQQK